MTKHLNIKKAVQIFRWLRTSFLALLLILMLKVPPAYARAGGGGGSSGGFSSGYSDPISPGFGVTSKSLPGVLLSGLILSVVLLPVLFSQEIFNFIRYRDKPFTTDLALIEYTRSINGAFKNAYSLKYANDSQIWRVDTDFEESSEVDFQSIIDRTELDKQVHDIFQRYQRDWSRKDFEQIQAYTTPFFYSSQEQIFKQNFSNSFDIVYRPELLKMVPIALKSKEDHQIIRIKILAKLVNFQVSAKGFVVSGKAESRCFTEHWDFLVDADKMLQLSEISQFG
ncbi:MAG: hypothetical protein AAGF66_09455 [Cyanobacteria bacterium P01_H01_bin.119]